MLVVVVATISTLICALVFTPLVKKFAIKLNAVAAPNHRTIHATVTPKLGGLAIVGAFAIGAALLSGGAQEVAPLLGLLLGGAVCVVLGFFDDLYVLNCYRKLLVQTLAAVIAVYFGFRIDMVSLAGGSGIELGMFSYPLTVFWIVGIMNAVNLLDGLDSLAAGFTIVLSLLFLAVAALTQNLVLASLAAILLASALGFLRYNFPPASIFMGDTGSLFLGFALACLAIESFTLPAAGGTNIAALLVCFSMPLADTTLATVRRLSEGHHPFWADRKHIHHRLLDSGLNQLPAALLMNGATVVFAVVSLAMLFVSWSHTLFLMSGVGVLFTLALYRLGCFDFMHKKDVLPEVDRIVITHSSASQPVSESANVELMFSIAWLTPLPRKTFLSPSRNSQAS